MLLITGDLLPVTSSVSYLKHLTFGTLNQCDKLRNTFLPAKIIQIKCKINIFSYYVVSFFRWSFSLNNSETCGINSKAALLLNLKKQNNTN